MGNSFTGSLPPTVVFVATLLTGNQAFAQVKGDVSVASKGSTGLEQFVERQRTALEPQLDLYVTPNLTYEKFDGYTEDATFRAQDEDDKPFVESPEFTITTSGLSAGANGFFPLGWVFGVAFTYGHADYDFKTKTRERASDEFNSDTDFLLGQPLDREFDEYGITLGIGYLEDQWSLLVTGGYSRRDNIKTQRREFDSKIFIAETSGNTTADLYQIELDYSYRFETNSGASIQPILSIGYQREEIDGYTEDFDAAFTCNDEPFQFECDGPFVRIPESEVPLEATAIRKFDNQTIESIPLQIGFRFGAPIGASKTDSTVDFSNISLSMSYTHDFDDQKRNVKSISIYQPGFSAEYEEKNRNQDFVSVGVILDFDASSLRGTFSYEHDVGFDERERAHTFSLQMGIPLQ